MSRNSEALIGLAEEAMNVSAGILKSSGADVAPFAIFEKPSGERIVAQFAISNADEFRQAFSSVLQCLLRKEGAVRYVAAAHGWGVSNRQAVSEAMKAGAVTALSPDDRFECIFVFGCDRASKRQVFAVSRIIGSGENRRLERLLTDTKGILGGNLPVKDW